MVKSGYFHSKDARIGPPGALCGDKMVKNGTYLPTPETGGVSMLAFSRKKNYGCPKFTPFSVPISVLREKKTFFLLQAVKGKCP